MKQSKIKKLANLCTTTKVAQRNRLYSIFGACATLNCVGGGGHIALILELEYERINNA